MQSDCSSLKLTKILRISLYTIPMQMYPAYPFRWFLNFLYPSHTTHSKNRALVKSLSFENEKRLVTVQVGGHELQALKITRMWGYNQAGTRIDSDRLNSTSLLQYHSRNRFNFLKPLSGICPLSGLCPNFCKKDCPMSFCPHFVCLEAGQGRDWAVLTYGVLVRRGLMCSDTIQFSW